jgi:phosphate-selective porin OprO/OprP
MKKHLRTKWLGLALMGLGAAASNATFAEAVVSTEGGLTVKDSAGAYSFKLGGKLQLDDVMYMGNAASKGAQFASGARVRRAVLNLKGGLGNQLQYELGLDFAPTNPALNVAQLTYTGIEGVNLGIGQNYAPFGLDNWASSSDIMFLEYSPVTAWAPDSGFGVYADTTAADMFSFAAMVFQPRHGTTGVGPAGKSDRLGESGRITFSPVHTAEYSLHAGASYYHQSYNYRDKGVLTNTFMTGFTNGIGAKGRLEGKLINTGNLIVRNHNAFGGELAGVWGPFNLQYEYTGNRLHNEALGQPKNLFFNAWHVQTGYILTGEGRSYDFPSGTIGGIKPSSEYGAWEVAFRYSNLNLNNKQVYGGSEKDMTFGLNWYANSHVRVALNYIIAKANATSVSNPGSRPTATEADKRKLNALAARLQLTF